MLHNSVLVFQTALRRAAFAAIIVLICALYLANLSGMGLVSADEPRYAEIGRAMAQTRDWVTPRLWGQPWFEKPALLYWMTAAAFRLGLGPDLAPRLPVALLSLAFLAFFWWRLRIEWDTRVASFASAMLATSAGWLAYSHVAVTDLPLAAFYSASLLLSLPWIARKDRSLLPAAAACLGIATLAKGLVPLVLFVPVLAIGWRKLTDWLRPGPLLAFFVCALPWYILCALRNGIEFPRVLFVEQTFGRFASTALQHAQPWWFYLPVLLLLLYPWFPILFFSGGKPSMDLSDQRVRALIAVAVFGFAIFSAALNKLPGYLLPLFPAICTVMALNLARSPHPARATIAPVMLLGALPWLIEIVPPAVGHGLHSVAWRWPGAFEWMIAGAIVGVVLAMALRSYALGVAVVMAGLGLLWFQFAAFPAIDGAASARPLWLKAHPQCAPALNRSELYGLYYYANRQLPACIADSGVIR